LLEEPVTMALVADDSVAMTAGRFEPAKADPSMNDFTKCSLLAVCL
jgi:hypothetical protein